MSRGKYRTNGLAAASLAMALALAAPVVALGGPRPPQQRRTPPPPPPQHQQAPRQPQAHPPASGHAGDWLRRYKDLPPAEQDRELQKDPAFRRLPPERQQQLRQRLQHFSDLPPQQQLRMLNRMETWEHLTPEQKQQARQIYGQMRQLPPDRQRMVQRPFVTCGRCRRISANRSSIPNASKACSLTRNAR